MMALRDLVRERLRALGDLRQQDFAARLAVDPRYVSAVLKGERPPPIDQVAVWAAALELDAGGSAELLDAMHLAASSDHVRALVERLEERATTAERLLARHRDRVGYVRYILDHVESPPGGSPPPPPDTPNQILALLVELVAARQRQADGAALGLPVHPPQGG